MRAHSNSSNPLFITLAGSNAISLDGSLPYDKSYDKIVNTTKSAYLILNIDNIYNLCTRTLESTICPRSLDLIYIVTYYIKWVITSWTYSNLALIKSAYTNTIHVNMYCKAIFKLTTSRWNLFVCRWCRWCTGCLRNYRKCKL